MQPSILGLGTWGMEWDDRAEVTRAIHKAIDLGMTHIDTAEMYGSGKVEEILGTVLEGKRDQVFLVSKVLPSNATYDGTIRACERSLRRLKTDHLDCYLLHYLGDHPLEETIRAFETLQQTGKIQSYGVSNFNLDQVRNATRISNNKIACNQVLYHLEERGIEHYVIPGCRELGISVVAYSPLAQGKFPPKDPMKSAVLTEIARAHNVTPAQVALAFVIRDPNLLAIPKSGSVRHVVENAGVTSVHLTEDEIAKLDLAFPKGPVRNDVPML
ncbi:MAG: aldo/keto reductase [Pseudomonadota bacterium]